MQDEVGGEGLSCWEAARQMHAAMNNLRRMPASAQDGERRLEHHQTIRKVVITSLMRYQVES